jgi:hypothetical protein
MATYIGSTRGGTNFGDSDVSNVGDIALDSISPDGTDINVALSDNSATALTIKQGSDAYLILDTANSSESVAIGTGISGTAISIGHATSETTVNDNLTVTGKINSSSGIEITSAEADTSTALVNPAASYTVGLGTAAAASNGRKVTVTIDADANSMSWANGAFGALTITNTSIDADSVIFASASLGVTTSVGKIADNSAVIMCNNKTGGALTADFTITYVIL